MYSAAYNRTTGRATNVGREVEVWDIWTTSRSPEWNNRVTTGSGSEDLSSTSCGELYSFRHSGRYYRIRHL